MYIGVLDKELLFNLYTYPAIYFQIFFKISKKEMKKNILNCFCHLICKFNVFSVNH